MEQKGSNKIQKKMTGKQKYDFVTETLFECLLVVAIIIHFFLVRDVIKLRKDLKELNPTYHLPQITDLQFALYAFLGLMVFKATLGSLVAHFVPMMLADKYKHPKNQGDYEMSKMLPEKIIRHFYKITMYSFFTIFGFIVLKDLDYFPKSLLGHGEMKNMFTPGYPNAYYPKRSQAFDIFYLTSFAASVFDFICLLKAYGTQSDFKNMLLHHTCTVSLILCSYLTNYSNIGALVLFVHNISDLPNHFTKLFLRIQVPEILTNIAGISFLLGFLYFRIYVFGEMLYTIYFYITWKWSWVTLTLTLFLIFLFIMNVNWTMILLYKFVKLLCHEKISDNVDFACEAKKDEKLDSNSAKEKKKD